MSQCNVESLLQLLANKLDLDAKLAVLEHVDECKVCKEAIFLLSRKRDGTLFISRPYRIDKRTAQLA